MQTFAVIIWDVDPELFRIGAFAPRWYGLLFATGFLLGYFITQWMFKREKRPFEWLDSLLLAMALGTVIGARLGHVFFYQWDYYSQHLSEILMIWKGGLASHGAAIAIPVALWIWSRRVAKLPFLWTTDHMVTQVALGGFFIRMGNLFNHEIVGKPTELPWAFQFSQYSDQLSRHPAQLYEALCYLSISAVLFLFYKKGKAQQHQGFMTGYFFAAIFGVRILIEFVKENQEAFEAALPLNMGQLLSIPCVLAGFYLMFRKARPAA